MAVSPKPSKLHALVQEFRGVAQDFEEHKWTTFTPHYLVWVCPDSYQKSDECKSQCIRKGRYCTPDPDGDTHKGYSGRDVVQARCCVGCRLYASGSVKLGAERLHFSPLRQGFTVESSC